MPYHNDKQKQANTYTQKANYMATAMSNLSYNMCQTLEFKDGVWSIDKHDGSAKKMVSGNYYEPDFLVESICCLDTETKIVKIDLGADDGGHEIKIALKPADDKEYRVTRIYLDSDTTATIINLLA